ncbi:MAG: hydroxyisourate hydrolase [Gemmatimonadota bacterium]|nr:MAG: hydroxyisourate hydrolase [Gemmatimonadota bacterium]
MSAITTHVLDLVAGLPAAGLAVSLSRRDPGESWVHLANGRTDDDGRASDLLPEGGLGAPGTYRLSFQVGEYFAARGEPTFYPEVDITFAVEDSAGHYHVPLLLSRFGYSTYRGS